MKTKTTPVRVRFAPLCLSEEALLNDSERKASDDELKVVGAKIYCFRDLIPLEAAQ